MNNNQSALSLILNNILDARDFLSQQYSLEIGLIDGEAFLKIKNEYFSSYITKSDEELYKYVKILYELLDDRLDIDITTIALKCEVDQAERLLMKLVNELKNGK